MWRTYQYLVRDVHNARNFSKQPEESHYRGPNSQLEQSPSPPLKFGWAIKGRQGKLVQKMKVHASEYAQHPALCGQVIKKKDAPCRKGTDQHVRIRSKILYICGQRSKMAFRARQAAATLLLLKYRYGRSFLLFILKIPSAQCVKVSKYIRTQAKFVERMYQYLWLKIYFRRRLESHVLHYALVRTAKNIPPQNAHACIYFSLTRKIADTDLNAKNFLSAGNNKTPQNCCKLFAK